MLQLHDLTKCLVFTPLLSTRFSSLLRAATVSRVILIMPLFAFCSLTSSAPELVMILSNAHPEPIRLVSSAGPPGHNTTAGLGSLLLLYSTSHSGQGIFSKKYTFSSWRDQPTRQRHFPEFRPIIAFSWLLRTPFDINKHALEEFLPGCENVGVHKSWVNSGLTPASPAGGAVMDLVAVLLLYFSILHQL